MGLGWGTVATAAVTRAELGEMCSPLKLPLKCGCPAAPLRSAERQRWSPGFGGGRLGCRALPGAKSFIISLSDLLLNLLLPFFFSDYRSSACLFVRKDTERQRNSKRVLDRPSLHWVVVIPEHVLISMHTGCKK